ncbi:MAG TPA: hypothetical protein DEA08_22020, partial [Planctomycetes bacterium]|nr:hypothetical protein [Planctomycetota bacterium]
DENAATRKRIGEREQAFAELREEIERKLEHVHGKLADETRVTLVEGSQSLRSEVLYDMEQVLAVLVARHRQLGELEVAGQQVEARRAQVQEETIRLAARARVLSGAVWEYTADQARFREKAKLYQRALAALDEKAELLPDDPSVARRRGSVLFSLGRLAGKRWGALRSDPRLESGGAKQTFERQVDFMQEAFRRALKQLDVACAAAERGWEAHLERVAVRRALAKQLGEGSDPWRELLQANLAELERAARGLREVLAAAKEEAELKRLEGWLFRVLTELQWVSYYLGLDDRCLAFCEQHFELMRARVNRGWGNQAPGVDRAHRFSAHVLLRKGRFAEALEQFQKFAAIESADEREDYCEAKLGAARCLNLLDRCEAAQARLDEVRRVIERIRPAGAARGMLLRQLFCEQLIVAGKGGANHAAAVRRALQALPPRMLLRGEDPEQPDFLRRAAQTVWGQGRRQLAQELFAQLLLERAGDPRWSAADVVQIALLALPPDLRRKARLKGPIVFGARQAIAAQYGVERGEEISLQLRSVPD